MPENATKPDLHKQPDVSLFGWLSLEKQEGIREWSPFTAFDLKLENNAPVRRPAGQRVICGPVSAAITSDGVSTSHPHTTLGNARVRRVFPATRRGRAELDVAKGPAQALSQIRAPAFMAEEFQFGIPVFLRHHDLLRSDTGQQRQTDSWQLPGAGIRPA